MMALLFTEKCERIMKSHSENVMPLIKVAHVL